MQHNILCLCLSISVTSVTALQCFTVDRIIRNYIWIYTAWGIEKTQISEFSLKCQKLAILPYKDHIISLTPVSSPVKLDNWTR